MNPFRQMLRHAGAQAPLGTWLMAASPLVAEAMGHAGFDWVVVDMEHAPLEVPGVVSMLQALSGTRAVPIVRTPWNDTVAIKRVLDAGATTLLVPFVQNADEARAAVAATQSAADSGSSASKRWTRMRSGSKPPAANRRGSRTPKDRR